MLSDFNDIKVPVKENGKTVTYTVEFPWSLFAISGGEIKVSNGSQNWKLKFKNNTTAKNAMAEYCVALHNLGKKVLNNVLKECVNVFINGGKDLLKAIFSDAPVDDQLQKIIDMTKEKTKAAVKKEIKAALPKNSTLNDALTKYETLTTAYKNLETLLNNDNSKLSAISAATKKFSDASTALNTSLKSLGAAVSLETFPNLSEKLLYNNNYTAVTVPSGLFGSFKSTVKKVDNSEWKVPVKMNGNSLDEILIGGSAKNTIYGNDGRDSLVGGKSDDELYGGADNDTLTGGAGKDIFYYASGDGKDVITDYTAGEDKIQLTNGSISKVTMSGKDVTFNIGKGSIKVQPGKDKKITVVLPDNTTNTYKNGKLISSVAGQGKFGTLDNNNLVRNGGYFTTDKNNNITGFVFVNRNNSIVMPATGALPLYYNGKTVKIPKVTGDTNGYTVTLTDVNDVTYPKFEISGLNVGVKVTDGDDTITTKALTDTVEFDADGNITGGEFIGTNYFAFTETLTNSTKSPFTAGSGIIVVDASRRTKAIKINGNDLDNEIIGGTKNDSLYGKKGDDYLNGGAGNDILSGYTGNDMLWGGAGNDTLYGGSGNDIFIYKPSEGTDKIMDYNSGDMLQILKSNDSAGGTYSKATFKNNSLTLAISGGGKVIFDGVSAGDQININGTIRTIKGSTLK